MARKTTPGARPARTGRRRTGTELVPAAIAGTSLVAPGEDGMGTVYVEGGTTMVVGPRYSFGGTTVAVDAVFYLDDHDRRAGDAGLGEADKIAWLDVGSGYECIIMRDARGGFLGGYVGLPPTHPLYGFDHRAIPADLDIEVHGGLSYSQACEQGPSPEPRLADEARRICHVPRAPRGGSRYAPVEHGSDYRVRHDDAWWLGFECDKVYDLKPRERDDRERFLAAETGGEYRDEAYVYREVVELAAQLRAIADGEPKPPRDAPSPPPVGLDPRRAG